MRQFCGSIALIVSRPSLWIDRKTISKNLFSCNPWPLTILENNTVGYGQNMGSATPYMSTRWLIGARAALESRTLSLTIELGTVGPDLTSGFVNKTRLVISSFSWFLLNMRYVSCNTYHFLKGTLAIFPLKHAPLKYTRRSTSISSHRVTRNIHRHPFAPNQPYILGPEVRICAWIWFTAGYYKFRNRSSPLPV